MYKKLGSDRTFRNSVKAHLEMFEYVKVSKCIYWNVANGCPRWLKAVPVNVIVLHTTLLSARYGDSVAFKIWKKDLSWIRNSAATKIAFPQDERYYSSALCRWLNDFRVDLVFSPVMFKPKGFHTIYGNYANQTEFIPCLTGYIDAKTMPAPDFDNWESRSMDVIYRAKTLPLWVGKYGALKSLIYSTLLPVLENSTLNYDISADVRDTKFGTSWTSFLRDARVIVGAEAGGSGNDTDGAVSEFILECQSKGAQTDYEELDRKFPGWDDHDFLVVGPRHLEAAATGTCQVLVEGEYCGILEAGEHYIPVSPDLSNLGQTIEQIDWEQAKKVAENAYHRVSGRVELTYAGFAESVIDKISENDQRTGTGQVDSPSELRFRMAYLFAKLLRRFGLISQLPHLSRLWFVGKWKQR